MGELSFLLGTTPDVTVAARIHQQRRGSAVRSSGAANPSSPLGVRSGGGGGAGGGGAGGGRRQSVAGIEAASKAREEATVVASLDHDLAMRLVRQDPQLMRRFFLTT